MDYKNIQFEMKGLSEDGTFEGKLSVYGVRDLGDDVVEAGSMTKTLQEAGSVVPLLWAHRHDSPIGVLSLKDTPTALMAYGKLVLDVPKAREAYALLKAGALKGLSIGYSVVKSTVDNNGVRRLRELKLFEGSLVSVPMNMAATVTAVKDANDIMLDRETLAMFAAAAKDLREFKTRMTR